jgi:hypothetical protein
MVATPGERQERPRPCPSPAADAADCGVSAPITLAGDDMTTAAAQKLVTEAKLTNNEGMILVYRDNPDGTVSIVHRTFRVDSVLRFLKRQRGGKFTATQQEARP